MVCIGSRSDIVTCSTAEGYEGFHTECVSEVFRTTVLGVENKLQRIVTVGILRNAHLRVQIA